MRSAVIRGDTASLLVIRPEVLPIDHDGARLRRMPA